MGRPGASVLSHPPLRAIAESNVAEALALVEELEDAARPDAFSTVLHAWEDHPYAAAVWLEGAAPEDAAWAKRDRESAASELREIANQQQRDAAATAILHTTADDLRIVARRAQDEGKSATALGGDVDFIEELYGRIRDAETRQDAAKLLHDAFDDIAPERAERYRALTGVIDESQ